jgi:hypothetical protein
MSAQRQVIVRIFVFFLVPSYHFGDSRLKIATTNSFCIISISLFIHLFSKCDLPYFAHTCFHIWQIQILLIKLIE